MSTTSRGGLRRNQSSGRVVNQLFRSERQVPAPRDVDRLARRLALPEMRLTEDPTEEKAFVPGLSILPSMLRRSLEVGGIFVCGLEVRKLSLPISARHGYGVSR
jgi:hypothetical protein